ncbi:DNA/RNA non-specific endonuclease [Roseococcus sp. YIM B11640]|uniref:DNA/RNA non-specific endonuclease n=1 Tax=Roseococcus sp. YIM B11640 TaxID=3133973 RepID=UPI003C7C0DE8
MSLAMTEAVPDMPAWMLDEDSAGAYRARRGYIPHFFGMIVPMPRPRISSVLAPTHMGGTELRYENFTILMHAERRMALVAAANVIRSGADGEDEADVEDWLTDPRMEAHHQPPPGLPRARIVRAEDVAHGTDDIAALRARRDSRHLANGVSWDLAGAWGELEDLVLEESVSERLCVFTGPILDRDDQGMPSRHWKVIVSRTAQGMRAHGFVLAMDGLRMQVPLVAIEFATGLDFGEVLHVADVYDDDIAFRLAARAQLGRSGRC